MDQPVNYFVYDIDFTLPHSSHNTDWIAYVVEQNHREISAINYIFCSDDYLLQLNQRYLSHHYLTDILTFPYEDEENKLLADIYISIDRVKENAAIYEVDWLEELHRVMIHGVLHLLGYEDHTASEQQQMRFLEEQALKTRDQFFPRE